MNSQTDRWEASPLRWGIMGAARIAGKSLIPAIRGTGAEIAVVAAGKRDRAEAFARTHDIPCAYEGYQRLLDDPKIEAVYLPLANGLHREWAIKTAQAGKHCLCEKPMALTSRDAEEITGAFAKAGRRIQEAFMWRHHAQIAWVQDQIAHDAVGSIRCVTAHFSFTLDRPNDYRWVASQGGGAFWDIGCYCVNAARYFFGAEPKDCSARFHLRPGPEGVDESAAGWMDFGEERLAIFYCSFVAGYHQGIELTGTKGRIWISKPWQQFGKPAKILIERDNDRVVQEFPPMNAYEEMIRHFTRSARDPNFSRAPAENGLAQAQAMEKLRSVARPPSAVGI